MKRTAPSPSTYSPPSKIPANIDITTQLYIGGLPEEVLSIISSYLTQDELLDTRLTSKQLCNIAEGCFKDLFRTMWKSDINFSPVDGSWCTQIYKWNIDFSQLKHSLPKVTWCVGHGADRKLKSLLHVHAPFHRKRMLRLLNAPTTLRLEDSPLHYACAIGCVDVLQVILSYPNGLESVNKLIQGECHGVSALWTPLHYAISCGHPAVLIENGANVNLTERGAVNIPFYARLCGNNPDIVSLLVDE